MGTKLIYIPLFLDFDTTELFETVAEGFIYIPLFLDFDNELNRNYDD